MHLPSAIACLLLTVPFLLAEDWPQFRGRNASGVSSGVAIPAEFSEKVNLA